MKPLYVVIVAAVLGVVLGGGMSWARFSHSPPLALSQPADVTATGKQPEVLVDNESFDFGRIERDTTVRHAFRFTNAGDAVLTLKAGVTTCTKCTISELAKPRVEPGETVDVVVEYTADSSKPQIRQIAPILTNDPKRPRVELNISGTVTGRYRLVPEEVVLSKVSANETKTTEVKIYALLADSVRVVGHEFMAPESARFFEMQSEPIPADQLSETDAKSGCLVRLTLKPGLPLGMIQQTIRLDLQLGEAKEKVSVEVPIEGIIDSDVSIVGPGWEQQLSRLSFSAVNSAKGATRKLLILLRGDRRHEVTIKTGKVDPSWLKVTLGEPSELKGSGDGGVTQVPLTIEIPPGMPPVNHLGTDQGKYAEVVLETTHPQVSEIRMNLKFVIEQ
jgi:hypothetical protein